MGHLRFKPGENMAFSLLLFGEGSLDDTGFIYSFNVKGEIILLMLHESVAVTRHRYYLGSPSKML